MDRTKRRRLKKEAEEWKIQAEEAVDLLEFMKDLVVDRENQIACLKEEKNRLQNRLDLWTRVFDEKIIVKTLLQNFDPEILYEEHQRGSSFKTESSDEQDKEEEG